MRMLVGCEFSGVVRDAFAARGWDAWSCDLKLGRGGGQHIMGDVRRVLSWGWDLAIFHPPCERLAVSGLHWNKRRPERQAETEAALDFVRELLAADIPRIALENPVGCISTRIAKPAQTIQPYDFGEDASKRTCLWLKNLPLLRPTWRFAGRITAEGTERWSNQTDSGQNRLGPSEQRSELRAITYPGVAAAMARQWSTAEALAGVGQQLSLATVATAQEARP